MNERTEPTLEQAIALLQRAQALAERAAKLAKCDLVSEMVGEFAELEGVMGRYYATLQGEPQAIADAVRDHYKPKGPGDQVPGNPVGVAVALADKLDTLVGFWLIDEKPTGSKDPFALRRAALGVIRTILERNIRVSLQRSVDIAALLTTTQHPKCSVFIFNNRIGTVTEGNTVCQYIVQRIDNIKFVVQFVGYKNFSVSQRKFFL